MSGQRFRRLVSRTRKLLGLGKRPSAHRDLAARFTYVYRGRTWKSKESASGPGSERSSGQVSHALSTLQTVVDRYDIRSMADVPCGDFNWMPAFLERNPQLRYAGYDIVKPLVLANRRRHPTHRFQRLDIVVEAPEAADLIFSKDLVNHLLNADIWKALENFAASGSTYLLITSNADAEPDVDLEVNVGGASRPLSLTISPFNLPPPLLNDGYFCLWRIEDLRIRLADR